MARDAWKKNDKLFKFLKSEDQLNWIEAGHKGQYTKIYPAEDHLVYKKFIDGAQRIFHTTNRNQIYVSPLKTRQAFPQPEPRQILPQPENRYVLPQQIRLPDIHKPIMKAATASSF